MPLCPRRYYLEELNMACLLEVEEAVVEAYPPKMKFHVCDGLTAAGAVAVMNAAAAMDMVACHVVDVQRQQPTAAAFVP